ncbi:MAG: hypothetical protein V4684_04595 [Pseudomonadota bacterium]
MALHFYLLVETYRSGPLPGHRGEVRVRAVDGQRVDSSLFVRAQRSMRNDYPVGSRFLIRAQLSTREGGGEYVNTSNWDPICLVTENEAQEFLRTGRLPAQG